MNNGKNLSILIPFYNEVNSIEDVLINLSKKFPNSKLIFIDDGSNDLGYEKIKKYQNYNIVILINEFNFGYGYSIKKALKSVKTQYVAWFDGDGEHDSDDLLKMYNIIISKNLSIVIGKRVFSNNFLERLESFL